jgi:hypothetical protein
MLTSLQIPASLPAIKDRRWFLPPDGIQRSNCRNVTLLCNPTQLNGTARVALESHEQVTFGLSGLTKVLQIQLPAIVILQVTVAWLCALPCWE